VCASITGYVLLRVWLSWDALVEAWPGVLALSATAMLTAYVAAEFSRGASVRLALTFVLAALWMLPSPAALLVATLAAIAGRGGGVAGLFRCGVQPYVALLVSVSVVDYIVGFSGAVSHRNSVWGTAWLFLLYLFIQGLAIALGRLWDSQESPRSARFDRQSRQALGLETANVAAAWLLVGLYLADRWNHVAVLALLVVAVEIMLVTLARTLQALRRTNLSLASRVGELHTLHAIGREILSSLEPERVFAIIDRGCREIFDVDTTIIAVTDHRTLQLRLVYRHVRNLEAETDEVEFTEALSEWVVQKRKSLRLNNRRPEGSEICWPTESHDRGMRSAMAAPLLAEGRVTGVLSVRSRRRAAFDDHQLSVLNTIAQQAAVAIENARNYEAATVDSLTGFFLRDYFFRRLGEEHERTSRYGGKFSLLMLDLDGFKTINDRHGHMTGDRFLHSVSRTIRTELRSADLACRYGGDEFCLLLPETGPRGARTIAERIRRAVAGSVVEVDGLELRSTVSIGVAVFPEHDEGSMETLLRNSDTALYRAKRAGRDRVVPYATRDQEPVRPIA
jgi:diguanylate cyclase (GGDEF)-like protein